MDYLFILYILVSVGIGLGGMVMLIQSERTLGGLLFLLGSILLFTFYGLRWFYGENLKATMTSSKQWPPVVNTCPDFLTLTNAGNKRVCIDLVGVSESGISKFVDQSNINSAKHVFQLYDNLSGQQRANALCNECKKHNVTWEGLWDGSSCVPTSGLLNAKGKPEITK
jgi:hypothetical protein